MRQKTEELRKRYPKGSRVELTEDLEDPYHPLPKGSRGTVTLLDDAQQLHVSWDDGGCLALIFGIDSFRIIKDSEEKTACRR